jgi:CMP-2-keto-3-deoxyoctulosonic acid synthetase
MLPKYTIYPNLIKEKAKTITPRNNTCLGFDLSYKSMSAVNFQCNIPIIRKKQIEHIRKKNKNLAYDGKILEVKISSWNRIFLPSRLKIEFHNNTTLINSMIESKINAAPNVRRTFFILCSSITIYPSFKIKKIFYV